MKGTTPKKCSVEDCSNLADLDVYLEDDYCYGIEFCEIDASCPTMCLAHAKENDEGSVGFGRERSYLFSKQGLAAHATGWTTYRNIHTGRLVVFTDHYGEPLDD